MARGEGSRVRGHASSTSCERSYTRVMNSGGTENACRRGPRLSFFRTVRRQRLVPRGTLSRLFQQAAEAWRRQDYEETIALLERAQRLDPANPDILLDLGRAHGLRYDYAAAERCLQQAVRIAPQKAEVLAQAGQRCQEFGHFEMATAFFEAAARETAVSSDTLVTLSELYERVHAAGQAAALIERSLRLQPEHSRALLARARLQRLANRLEEAEQGTRVVLAATSCDSQTRIRAWYELGGILDRQGRFDEAMEAFLEA